VPWTHEEDCRLADLVASLGQKWKKVQEAMHGRTSRQCMERYQSLKTSSGLRDSNKKRQRWSKDEIDQLEAL